MSNVVYIGASKNLRKRIMSYLGANLKVKNKRLSNFIANRRMRMRFYRTNNFFLIESKLLEDFKNIFDELPRANSLGGNSCKRR